MARWPRLVAAGLPLHITQRGHNKDTTFLDDKDLSVFREMLSTALQRTPCALHAYALMTNHVHLLLTPDHPRDASRLMQGLTGRFVRYWNTRHHRSGTLWGGRFHSSIVGADRYLLSCMRYIDLNPVRAGIVASPEMYEWSSYRTLALGEPDPMVTPHAVVSMLGATPADTHAAYRDFCAWDGYDPAVTTIRLAIRGGAAIGTLPSLARIETLVRHPVTRGARGGNRREAFARAHHGV